MGELGPASSNQELRRSSASAVLDVLRALGPATATDVVERTGLSRPTVHTACGELIELGWVEELEPVRPQGPGQPGRSARRYRFRAQAAYVVGIDIGAHTVTAALADLDGRSLAQQRRQYRDPLVGADERLATVRRTLADVLAQSGVDEERVMAATVGIPGPVDRERGSTVANETFLPGLDGLDLRKALELPAHWTAVVENDCNLAALGEHWRGVAVGARDVVVVLAGERLGAGILMDSRLVRGRAGGAGELSYLFLVEGVGNADGIAAVARELGERVVADGWSPPGDGPVSAETVLRAAADGDEVALALVDEIGRRFARVATTLNLLLDPELLVFAGAVAQDGEVFLSAIRRHVPALLERMDAPPFATGPRIEASRLGERVVVTGAIRLALDLVASGCLGATGAPIRPAPGVGEAA